MSLFYSAGLGAAAIPDLGLDNFWFLPDESDISTINDQSGSIDVSAVGDPSFGSINDNQSAEYNGSDEFHTNSTVPTFGSNDEYTAVVVCDPSSSSGFQRPLGLGDAGYTVGLSFSNSQYQVVHPGVASVVGGTLRTGPQVIVMTYDGSTAIMDVNKTNVVDQSLGSPTAPESTNIGFEGGGSSFYFTGDVGAAGHEAAFADSTRRDELTDKLANEFDITT